MPILDGLQATRQIRNIESTWLADDQGSRTYSSSKAHSFCQQGHEVHAEANSISLCTVFRVPIVGVSACSKTEQLQSAQSDGLLGDRLTGMGSTCAAWLRTSMVH